MDLTSNILLNSCIVTDIILWTHICCGFISIILFWLPLFSRKGNQIHIKTGKVYVLCMWIVVITAALLSINNVIIGSYNLAVFLGFISLITGGPLWYSVAILNQKNGRTYAYNQKLFLYHLAVVLSALAMIAYGFTISSGAKILMFIFGGLGLTSIVSVLKYLQKKESRLNWIQEHLIGMITSGIAAYTAFIVFGGQNFFGEYFSGYSSIILWTAPGILGTLANIFYSRKYAKS